MKNHPPFQEGDRVIYIGNEHFGILEVVEVNWITTCSPPHWRVIAMQDIKPPDPKTLPPNACGIVVAGSVHAAAECFRRVEEK